MTLNPIDAWFENHDEPSRGCLAFLRQRILAQDEGVMEVWRYGMPFYCIQGKRFAYLWVDKKRKQPYIGIVDGGKINHPDLLQENRSRMKIYLVDPFKDVPVGKIEKLLGEVMALYQHQRSHSF